MNCFIPERPIVVLGLDPKGNVVKAFTNIHPSVKVAVAPIAVFDDLEGDKGNPFDIQRNVEQIN